MRPPAFPFCRSQDRTPGRVYKVLLGCRSKGSSKDSGVMAEQGRAVGAQ